jgi:hypothetical protein
MPRQRAGPERRPMTAPAGTPYSLISVVAGSSALFADDDAAVAAYTGRTSTTSGTKCLRRFWMPCCNVAVDDGQPAQEPFMLR